MVDLLGDLVGAESPTADISATRACADRLAALGSAILGLSPERIELDGRPHLCWGDRRASKVMLLGHFDTVWPVGTIDRWPFEVRDEIATGPGAFDMKGGIVQGLMALAQIGTLNEVVLLLTSDEEIGAPTSRGLIEETARAVDATLVLEPSANGALKVARKGVATYRIVAHGRAAHAGLEPERGRNALVEIAHQLLAIAELSQAPTTVTPTVARAGSAANTVPAEATITVDVRALSQDEQDRVDAQLHGLRPHSSDVELVVERVVQSPPFPRSASRELFARAQRIGERLGFGPLEGAEVGGGSDGNYTASVGTPTLDGLGPVGDGAHAEGEHVVIDAMPERAALVAALVAEILSE